MTLGGKLTSLIATSCASGKVRKLSAKKCCEKMTNKKGENLQPCF
jgi:hypothetical protein